jgi:hypothetical protein
VSDDLGFPDGLGPPPPGPQQEQPAQELELQPRPSAPEPRPSAPGGVRSAFRAQPLPEQKKKITKAVVREGAVEVLLNAFSILKEIAEDFRSSDRFFKYKALVLSVWLVLSITSVGVSCAGGSGPAVNSFGARLVVAGEGSTRAFMVKNDSDDEWQSVQITVNGRYYVTAAQLRPYGDISLSPRLMFDENGKEAPGDLAIRDVHLSCNEGEAFLLKGGTVP